MAFALEYVQELFSAIMRVTVGRQRMRCGLNFECERKAATVNTANLLAVCVGQCSQIHRNQGFSIP